MDRGTGKHACRQDYAAMQLICLASPPPIDDILDVLRELER